MKGNRIPVTDPKIDPYQLLKNPGDYYGPVMGFSGDRPAVFFLLPILSEVDVPGFQRALHHVESPPHTFTEESDGSLTIRNSIGAGPRNAYYWHGHLENGEWRLA